MILYRCANSMKGNCTRVLTCFSPKQCAGTVGLIYRYKFQNKYIINAECEGQLRKKRKDVPLNTYYVHTIYMRACERYRFTQRSQYFRHDTQKWLIMLLWSIACEQNQIRIYGTQPWQYVLLRRLFALPEQLYTFSMLFWSNNKTIDWLTAKNSNFCTSIQCTTYSVCI